MTDWTLLDGRKIARVDFPRFDETTCPYVQSDEKCDLICKVEYLGDRTEVWILDMRGGKEFARYNARFAETILWAAP